MKAGNLWYQMVEEPATRDWGGAQGDLCDSNLNDCTLGPTIGEQLLGGTQAVTPPEVAVPLCIANVLHSHSHLFSKLQHNWKIKLHTKCYHGMSILFLSRIYYMDLCFLVTPSLQSLKCHDCHKGFALLSISPPGFVCASHESLTVTVNANQPTVYDKVFGKCSHSHDSLLKATLHV